ncbi:hypothetical protein D9M73_82630 [compost metagenome]|nr:MAG TPA: hypothetical protein [Caudoviricetes sp.]
MATNGIIGGALTDPLANPNDPTATGTQAPTPSPSANPAPVPSPTAGYTPTAWNVTNDQTVAGQVAKIVDPNSPIIQQARSQAAQVANDRGLMNSSIAMTAADDAAYRTAVPIATADAATYAKAAGYNADSKTTSDAFKANADNTLAGQKLNSDTSIYIAAANNEAAKQLKTMDQQTQALVQNNAQAQSAYNLYANSLYKNAENPNFDAQAKYDADMKAFTIFQQQVALAAAMNGLPDLSHQLSYNGVNPT